MPTEILRLPLAPAGEATERPIAIAIVAMGGQGGGVLTGWIVALAEAAGWVAQSTSVPGVAQRTGATIYYVEMMPMRGGRKPVLAQMPTPGDVDVVLASEFMEAGRSILRGIVTPGRTTLIASDHRALSIGEKSAPGDGIADSGVVHEAIGATARARIVFDMNALAVANGSVISSALFGALAGSGVLPFAREAYHAVIAADGKGVAASIRTFDAAFARAAGEETPSPPLAVASPEPAPVDAHRGPLASRLIERLPPGVHAMARAGLAKVVDFQDHAYGREYCGLLEQFHTVDLAAGGAERDHAFTREAAKYLAQAMAYDDIVRVADLKTRSGRHARIAAEANAAPGTLLHTTEYMHPRLEEVAGILPAPLADWLTRRPRLFRAIDRRISKGRRVRTYSVGWFLTLYAVAGLSRLRRSSLRHRQEVAHRDAWLALATRLVASDYALGVEVLRCRRLVKGYSDTHARGLSKFDRVIATIETLAGRDDAADWARRLRETAVRDGEDKDLDGLIRTIASFMGAAVAA